MFDANRYRSELVYKRRRGHRLFWWMFGGAVTLLVLCLALLYLFLNLSWFEVSKVEVSGTDMVPTSSVEAAVELSMLRGPWNALLGPKNILFWQMGRKPAGLLRFPGLKDLNVSVDFWKRAVSISAADRPLWGVLCEASSTTCYALDDQGQVFAYAPETSGSLILRVDDQNGRVLVPGEPFLPEASWINNFYSAVAGVEKSGLGISSIRLEDLRTRDWDITLPGGTDLKFNLDFVPQDLSSLLVNLRTKLDFSKLSEIDLSVPNRIYYK